MKAIEKNGIITIYKVIPNIWSDEKGTVLNFKNANHSDYGLYDVIEPFYVPKAQLLGDIYFDEENEVFTYPVIDGDFDQEDIDNLKDSKITEIKLKSRDLLQPTDWYVIRKAERGIDIPDQIASYRLNVLNKLEEFELQIKNLNSYLEVAIYDYKF
jgi:hypothetical protein